MKRLEARVDRQTSAHRGCLHEQPVGEQLVCEHPEARLARELASDHARGAGRPRPRERLRAVAYVVHDREEQAGRGDHGKGARDGAKPPAARERAHGLEGSRQDHEPGERGPELRADGGETGERERPDEEPVAPRDRRARRDRAGAERGHDEERRARERDGLPLRHEAAEVVVLDGLPQVPRQLCAHGARETGGARTDGEHECPYDDAPAAGSRLDEARDRVQHAHSGSDEHRRVQVRPQHEEREREKHATFETAVVPAEQP